MLKEILGFFFFFFGAGLVMGLWIAMIRLSTNLKLRAAKKLLGSQGPIVAFFHPQAGALGGGEKVLFQAIAALQNSVELPNDISIVVYSGSDMLKERIFQLVKERFNIDADSSRVKFVKLTTH